MKRFIVALGAAGLAAFLPAKANEELAKKHGCFACHAAKLFDKVKKGGSGVWGQVPMPPNSQVPDGDIKTLVKWILSQK